MITRPYIYLLSFLVVGQVAAVSHSNLFNPYDILLHPPLMPAGMHCLTAAYEGAVSACGYQDDTPDCREFRRCVGVLQSWQSLQDGLAAFKGTQYDSKLGQVANLFSRDDDAGNQALFAPCADFSASNLMFMYQYQWSSTTSWAFYLPVVHYAFKNVRFVEQKNGSFFESTFAEKFRNLLEDTGHIALHDQSRTTLGDITTLVWWEKSFPQMRPMLRNVTLRLRGGLTFPTAKGDCESFIPTFFNYDASWGILGGATIQFAYSMCVGLGIDVEVLNLFGSQRTRRVKTDPAQTDLLFLERASTFRDPGFVQHYTVWGSLFITPQLTFRVAYQYVKQQDDQLFVASQSVDAEIANTAESLLEWTTNSAVFQLIYEVPRGEEARFFPRVGAFYKIGFNGKRAVLADTVGLSLDIAF